MDVDEYVLGWDVVGMIGSCAMHQLKSNRRIHRAIFFLFVRPCLRDVSFLNRHLSFLLISATLGMPVEKPTSIWVFQLAPIGCSLASSVGSSILCMM